MGIMRTTSTCNCPRFGGQNDLELELDGFGSGRDLMKADEGTFFPELVFP